MCKRIVAGLLAFTMIFGTAISSVNGDVLNIGSGVLIADAEGISSGYTIMQGTKSKNAGGNQYRGCVYQDTINSYLVENNDSTLTRVEFIESESKIIVENYSHDGTDLLSTKTIPMELNIAGGFYSGEKYNFIVVGQENTEKNDNAEVVRVVKYSKDWERISSVSYYGHDTNVYIPFDAGSLRMAEGDGKLYIHSCCEAYSNHQSSMHMTVNESDMSKITLDFGPYISHSFNQFIKIEQGNGYILDHGDGHPRGIKITKYGETTNDASRLLIDLSAIGYTAGSTNNLGVNNTGAFVGGFEIMDNNCLVVGSCVDYTNESTTYNDTKNVFVSVTDKNDFSNSKVIWLTDYVEGSNNDVGNPQLVKLNGNRALVMWKEHLTWNTTQLKMVLIDENGNILSDIVSSKVKQSDCQPILCDDGCVRWYVTYSNDSYVDAENEGLPVLYTVDPNDLTVSAQNICSHNGDWETVKEATCAVAGAKTRTCPVCGKTETQTIPATGTHTYGDWETVKEATCTVAGAKTRTCSVCGKTETQIIPATGTHTYGDWKTVKEATCIVAGAKTRTCSVCGKTETQTIAKTDHKSSDWIILENTRYKKCTICGEILEQESYNAAYDISNCNIKVTSPVLTSKYVIQHFGQAKTTDVSVYAGSKLLTENVDYTLSYSDNLFAGTAKVTVTGIGNYEGTATKTFLIKYAFSGCSVSGISSSYTYTGSEIKPKPTVIDNGEALSEGVDYTVSYYNNKNVGTATVKITGKGDYKGEISKTFTIKTKTYNIANATVTGISSTYAYKGSAVKPVPTVKYGNKTLVKNTDYTVSYSNNINVGTATVKITGKGNYTGTINRTFKIKYLMSNVKISGYKNSYTYTGKAMTPNITVKNGTKILTKNKDYTVSYSSNKNTGKAKITITGKSNYTGTVTKYFYIIPKKVSSVKLNRPRTKTIKVSWAKDTQASGYQIVYARNSKFTSSKKTVDISSYKTTSKTIGKLTKGKTYYVKVRAYKLVNGVKKYGSYSTVKSIRCN